MKFKIRTFVVLLSVLLSWLFLKDTIQWYFFMPNSEKDLISLNSDEIDKLPKKSKEKVINLKKKRKQVISMGLDLQGGLYLVLSLNEADLKKTQRERYTLEVKEKYKQKKYINKQPDQKTIEKEIEKLMKDNYSRDKNAAVLSAYNRIGNRIDQFGISEPIIQKGFDNRIYISLAGIKDPQAAEEIVSRAGKLTFQIYDKETQTLFTKKYGAKKPELFQNFGTPRSPEWRLANNFEMPKNFKTPKDSKVYFFWENDAFGIPKKKGGIFIKKKVLLDGKHIKHAYPSFDQYANNVNVAFSLDGKGADIFAKVTGENVNKRLAIILDGKVKSYPNIQNKIPGGRGIITGSFTPEEARNLSAILNAGSFNVGLRIEEKRSVGPSLGKDSVNAGVKAVVIGFILVIVFMLIYYKFGGLIADIAVMFNFVIVLAVMTQLGATLTLPGIAGLILTLGMSVDANVIIFERIKEELRDGKSQIRVAVDKGFNRAFRTIFDANITTLLAALVLMQLGTGAIKGFAVTLLIGILSSMYTALFLSRYLIDGSISVFKLKKIAI